MDQLNKGLQKFCNCLDITRVSGYLILTRNFTFAREIIQKKAIAEKTRELIKKHSENKIPSEERHHAIVIIQYNDGNENDKIYSQGIDLLIEYYEKEKTIQFLVKELDTREKFIDFINHELGTVSHLWIFGHGYKGGLNFFENGKKNSFSYENLERTNFVYFVGQMHCSSGKGTLLKNILKAEKWIFVEHCHLPSFDRKLIEEWILEQKN
jgi:hypothetical protein